MCVCVKIKDNESRAGGPVIFNVQLFRVSNSGNFCGVKPSPVALTNNYWILLFFSQLPSSLFGRDKYNKQFQCTVCLWLLCVAIIWLDFFIVLSIGGPSVVWPRSQRWICPSRSSHGIPSISSGGCRSVRHRWNGKTHLSSLCSKKKQKDWKRQVWLGRSVRST